MIINVECGSEKYFDADIAGDLNITRTRRVLRESYDDLGEHNALAGGDLEYCENNVTRTFLSSDPVSMHSQVIVCKGQKAFLDRIDAEIK